MKPEDWARLDTLLEGASVLPATEREAWLRARCGDDGELLALALAGSREGSADSRFLRPPSLAAVVGPGEEAGLAGRRLGEFELRERIGVGGMGVVYRATQSPLGRDVAVKVLSWSAMDDPSRRERFVREARAIAKLDHPGIVRIFAAAEEQGVGYLAMELLPGPDLAAEIERLARRDASPGALPAFEAPEYLRAVARLVAQAADALDCAHGQGVVHRDVKPANLLFDGEGSVKWVDFGLARDASAAAISRSGEAMGTPAYMSPEQVRARPREVDARTDVYSLGVVLFELLTLRRPYEGDLPETLVAIARGDAPPPSGLNRRVPRDLDLICRTAMARDRDARYPSAAALRDDLEHFLRGEAISASPPSFARRLADAARRHRVAVIAGAAVLVALWLGAMASRLQAAAAERARLPDVRLTLDEPTLAWVASLEGSGGSVRVQRRSVDELSGALGPPIELGRFTQAEFLDRDVSIGNWRYIVRVDGSEGVVACGEYTRYVVAADGAADRSIDVHLRRESPADRAAPPGMVKIAAHRHRFDQDLPFGCTPRERECDVEAFWIDEREVSNGDYARFLEETGHTLPMRWRNLGCKSSWRELPLGEDAHRWLELPVAGLSWLDARAYAEWAGKRLPTHVELECALRGEVGAKSLDQFGTAPGVDALAHVNVKPNGLPTQSSEFFANYLASVAPVGDASFRQPPLGLHHAYGNVAEFTESFFADAVDGEFVLQPSKRVYLGGSWDARFYSQALDTHAGTGIDDAYIKDYVGFRCVRSAAP